MTSQDRKALADELERLAESIDGRMGSIQGRSMFAPGPAIEETGKIRAIATALRASEVTEAQVRALVIYEGHTPENAYAMKLARDKLEHVLSAEAAAQQPGEKQS